MRCEDVLAALAAAERGKERGPAVDAHVASCPVCRPLAAAHGIGVVAAPPAVPAPAAFRARARRRVAVQVGAALAVVLALGGAFVVGGGVDSAAPAPEIATARPPVDVDAGLWDVLDDAATGGLASRRDRPERDPLRSALLDDLVPDDPVGAIADPSDLFEAALLGEGS